MAELARHFRSLYPGDYDDLKDDELERLVLDRYPDNESYRKMVNDERGAMHADNPEVDRIIASNKRPYDNTMWDPEPGKRHPIKTAASPDLDEEKFRDWYRPRAEKWDINPDPDDPQHHYDYRKAMEEGAEPNEEGHWPSTFKDDQHPNLIVNGVNTKTGERVAQNKDTFFEPPRRDAKPVVPNRAPTPQESDSRSIPGGEDDRDLYNKFLDAMGPEAGNPDLDAPDPNDNLWKKTWRAPQALRRWAYDIEQSATNPENQWIKPSGKGDIRDTLADQEARFRGMATGSLRGATDIFGSPGAIGLALLTGGSSAIARAAIAAGAKEAPPLLTAANKLIHGATGAGFAYEGVDDITGENKTPYQRAMGVAKLAGGIAGIHSMGGPLSRFPNEVVNGKFSAESVPAEPPDSSLFQPNLPARRPPSGPRFGAPNGTPPEPPRTYPSVERPGVVDVEPIVPGTGSGMRPNVPPPSTIRSTEVPYRQGEPSWVNTTPAREPIRNVTPPAEAAAPAESPVILEKPAPAAPKKAAKAGTPAETPGQLKIKNPSNDKIMSLINRGYNVVHQDKDTGVVTFDPPPEIAARAAELIAEREARAAEDKAARLAKSQAPQPVKNTPIETPETPPKKPAPPAKAAARPAPKAGEAELPDEVTNVKGDISLKDPDPDRIAELEQQGFTNAGKTSTGRTVMLAPKAKTKPFVNPFKKPQAPPIAAAPVETTAPVEEEPIITREDKTPTIGGPEFQAVGEEDLAEPEEKPVAKSTEDKELDKAREKFGMGLVPEEGAPPARRPIRGLLGAGESEPRTPVAQEEPAVDLEKPVKPKAVRKAKTKEKPQKFSSFEDLGKSTTDLSKLPQPKDNETVMEYHERTGASIADSEAMVNPSDEDITPSGIAKPKGKQSYNDLTPETYKRYHVYDENDNLIDKTYDHQEAQKWADENDGYVKDIGEEKPSGIHRPGGRPGVAKFRTRDEMIRDNIAKETKKETAFQTSMEWNNRAEQLEKFGDKEGAKRANEIAKIADKRYNELIGKEEPIDPAVLRGTFKQWVSYHPNSPIVDQVKDMLAQGEDPDKIGKFINKNRFMEGDEEPSAMFGSKKKVKIPGTNKSVEIPELPEKTEEVKVPEADEESEYIRMETGDREAMLRNMQGQYAEHGARVANKELLQNAIDATETNGHVAVHLNFSTAGKGPSITVTDQGPGLPIDMIRNEYITLTGSGKRGKESTTGRKPIGEMGVGKATYMLGTDSFEVTTVAKEPDGTKWKYEFGGTPEDMITNRIKVTKTKMSDKEPTGTSVTVYDSDVKNIDAAKDYLRNFAEYSNNAVNVVITDNQWGNNNTKNVEPRTADVGKFVASGTGPGGDYTITIPNRAKWNENQGSTVAVITSRGMYQGAENIHPPGYGELPDHVVVNIEPNVPANDAKNYPLTAPTRERLKAPLKQIITREVDDKIMKASKEKKKQRTQQAFDEMIPADGNDFVVHDIQGKYTPEELDKFNNNSRVKKVAAIMKVMLDELEKQHPEARRITAKYGFLAADPGSGGYNIPDPKSAIAGEQVKSAIVVNMMDAINESDNPEQAAEIIAHITLHEFNHNIATDEGANFTWELSRTDSKYTTRRRAQIADLILNAITGPDGGYASDIQELLQEYKDSRGRPGTKEDLLVRPQSIEKPGPEESETVSPTRKPNGEGTSGKGRRTKKQISEDAVNKLLDGLERAKGMRGEHESMITEERHERFTEFEGVETRGVKGAAEAMGKLAGKYETVDLTPLEETLSYSEINSLFDTIRDGNVDTTEKARGIHGLFMLIEGQMPPRSDVAVLDHIFGNGFGNKIVQMHATFGVMPFKLGKTIDTMKAMRSAFDFSAPLRQGIMFIRKPEYWKAFAKMFQYAFNPKLYKGDMEAIEDDPEYKLIRGLGLFLAHTGNALTGEEVFGNTFIDEIKKLPGMQVGKRTLGPGQLYGAGYDLSERAYTGFLNHLRFHYMKNMLSLLRAQGIETHTYNDKGKVTYSQEAKDMARMINVGTGRGNLGEFEKIARGLSRIFWSPKLLKARFDTLNPIYYKNLSGPAQKEALKNLLATASLIIGATMLAKYAFKDKVKVSTDPLSADFMKMRDGDTLIDPNAGFQQPVVALSRFLVGKSNGKPKSYFDVALDFFGNKLAPGTDLAYDISRSRRWTRKNKPITFDTGGDTIFGKPPDISKNNQNWGDIGYEDKYGNKKNLGTEIARRFTPMVSEDVLNLAETDQNWMKQIGLDIYSILGGGVQKYPETNANRPKRRRQRLR